MVFWAGVLFLVVSATPIREQIALAIPHALRTAAAGGIGLLLTLLGLKNAGIVVAIRRRWSGWARWTTGAARGRGAGYATAALLVLVAVSMFQTVSTIDLSRCGRGHWRSCGARWPATWPAVEGEM